MAFGSGRGGLEENVLRFGGEWGRCGCFVDGEIFVSGVIKVVESRIWGFSEWICLFSG